MIRRHPPLVAPHKRRSAQEPVVAMINVVFLLLIFFLMTAQIAPPDPLEVTLPTAPSGMPDSTAPLFIAADGTVAYGALRGDAALQAAAHSSPLGLHADATLDAARLATILAQLRALGAETVHLITDRPAP